MKLIFPCRQCGAKLKVDHAQVGTKVKCENCDAVQPVPAPLAKKYRVLGIAAAVLQGLAVLLPLVVIASIFIVIDQYYHWGDAQSLILLCLGIPTALVAGVLIYAVGEGIRLCIDLEENIRATRLLMETTRSERRTEPAETPQ